MEKERLGKVGIWTECLEDQWGELHHRLGVGWTAFHSRFKALVDQLPEEPTEEQLVSSFDAVRALLDEFPAAAFVAEKAGTAVDQARKLGVLGDDFHTRLKSAGDGTKKRPPHSLRNRLHDLAGRPPSPPVQASEPAKKGQAGGGPSS